MVFLSKLSQTAHRGIWKLLIGQRKKTSWLFLILTERVFITIALFKLINSFSPPEYTNLIKLYRIVSVKCIILKYTWEWYFVFSFDSSNRRKCSLHFFFFCRETFRTKYKSLWSNNEMKIDSRTICYLTLFVDSNISKAALRKIFKMFTRIQTRLKTYFSQNVQVVIDQKSKGLYN